MKIDKEKLAAFAALPDDKLWAEVVALAASHGFKLSEVPPSADEMKRLRGAIIGGARLNLAEAARIVNEYNKRGKKNG